MRCFVSSKVHPLEIAWTETLNASGDVTVSFGGKTVDFADVMVAGAEALGSSIVKALGSNLLLAKVGEGTVPGTFEENLWFQQIGNNLQIDVLGTNNHLTIDNWFGGTNAVAVTRMMRARLIDLVAAAPT